MRKSFFLSLFQHIHRRRFRSPRVEVSRGAGDDSMSTRSGVIVTAVRSDRSRCPCDLQPKAAGQPWTRRIAEAAWNGRDAPAKAQAKVPVWFPFAGLNQKLFVRSRLAYIGSSVYIFLSFLFLWRTGREYARKGLKRNWNIDTNAFPMFPFFILFYSSTVHQNRKDRRHNFGFRIHTISFSALSKFIEKSWTSSEVHWFNFWGLWNRGEYHRSVWQRR